MNDNVFEIKPPPEETFKSLLRDNATDLWDKGEKCLVDPSVNLENELIKILCKPSNETFINEALWIGGDSGEFEQLLMAFIQEHPHHPLSIHVDKSLRGYLQLVIEKEEATILEANAAEEESYRQDYGRDEPPWGEEQ